MHPLELIPASNIAARCVDFWLRQGDSLCTEVTMQRFDPMQVHTKPAFSLSEDEAQSLMDRLWRCGFRPKESGASVGQMDAVQQHLTDMRTIAFTFLHIDNPDAFQKPSSTSFSRKEQA
jgi:hypothetical protein